MKHEHNAWAEPQRFHLELRTLVIMLGALQVVADVFQVLGVSI